MKGVTILLVCLVATFVLVVYNVGSVTSAIDCSRRLRGLNRALNRMSLISNPRILPFNNTEEFDLNYCSVYKSWLKGVARYKPCLKAFSQTLIPLAIRSFTQTSKVVCQSQQSKSEMVSHSQCLTPLNKEKLKASLNRITLSIEYIRTLQQDEMIPGICCTYYLAEQRLEREIGDICDGQTGLQTGKYMSDLIRHHLTDMTDILCGTKYASINSCIQQQPDLTKKLNSTQNRNKPILPYSFLFPMIKLADSLA